MIVKSLKYLTILFSCICCMTGWLLDIWCCNSIFNSHDINMLITWPWYVNTWHLIPDTWYLTLVLDMLLLDTWYLTFDIWHRYLTCYNLTPDTWHLISDIGIWHVITWHLIPDTWYMTLDNWHAITYLTCFHMVLVHLTWCCDTWLDTITPDTCTILHIHDYHFYGDLDMIIILLPDTGTLVLLNPVSSVLMFPAMLFLLIAQSYQRPAEPAWCQDDEDVSHIMLASGGSWMVLSVTRNKVPHHTRGGDHFLNLWGAPLEFIPHTEQSATWSKVPHHTRGGGHLLNLWGYLLNLSSKGNIPPSCLCCLVLAW